MKTKNKEWLYILGFVIILLTILLGLENFIKATVTIILFILACILRFLVPNKPNDEEK